MGRRFLLSCLLFVPLFASAHPASLGVIGDSIAVGSLAHPELKWDLVELSKIVDKGKIEPDPKAYSKDFAKVIETDVKGKVVPPKRVWGSSDAPEWIKKKAADLVDLEEYAWPYLLARAIGVPTKGITYAGELGRRAGDTKSQASALVGKAKTLPERVVVAWTGNDLCGQNLDEKMNSTAKQTHSDRIFDGLKLLLDSSVPEAGSKIFVVSHLNVAQLVDSNAVLDKKVYAFGEERKVRDLRKHKSDKDALKDVKSETFKALVGILNLTKGTSYTDMPPVADMCKSILTTHKGEKGYDGRLERIREYTKAYREGAKDAVERANERRKEKAYADKKVEFHFLTSTEDFDAKEESMANDGFHLSLQGHEEVARLLEKEIKAKKLD